MASTSIWYISSLELGIDSLEPSDNDKSSSKDLLALC